MTKSYVQTNQYVDIRQTHCATSAASFPAGSGTKTTTFKILISENTENNIAFTIYSIQVQVNKIKQQILMSNVPKKLLLNNSQVDDLFFFFGKSEVE